MRPHLYIADYSKDILHKERRPMSVHPCHTEHEPTLTLYAGQEEQALPRT